MCGSRRSAPTPPPAPKPAPMNAAGIANQDEADLTVKKKKKTIQQAGTKGYRNSSASANTSLNVGKTASSPSGLNISK